MSSPGPTLLAAARVLELSGEPLDPEQLAALARLISRPASRLRSLALRACSLDDAALARLAPALASAPALATLDLGDNPLTCESAARLAAIVRAHPALTRLELDGTAIGARGAAALIDALPGARLERLGLPPALPPALARRKVALLCANRNRAADSKAAPARRAPVASRPAPAPTPRAAGEAAPDDAALATAAATLRALTTTPQRLLDPPDGPARALRDAVVAAARALRRQPAGAALTPSKRQRQRDRDAALIARVGIRQTDARAAASRPPTPVEDGDADSSPATLSRDLRCYVCKRPFRQLHAFYDRLCPECAALNLAKREQSGDLRGRVALLTGGRVRTGYAVALKLLRAGATVIVTTRFPRDAVRRFAREPDFDRLRARLQLYRLDLIDVPRVEALTAHLEQALPQLDILINLAAQTVYKPPSFHARAVAHELEPLPPELRACLRALPGDPDQPERVLASEPVALARVDEDPRLGARWRAARADDPRLFPDDPAREDPFAAPLDLRSANSWRLKLEEIGAVELLEVVLINITAPFILCSRLRRALARGPARPRFVVNVSAPEGQFYRAYKGPFHPHANMSKAALNMLTRTSADDYARDRIFMNSVDPGWISNDNPQPIAARMTARGFHPPIDVVDAAARVCDPIFVGADDESRCVHGQLLKDYQPAPW